LPQYKACRLFALAAIKGAANRELNGMAAPRNGLQNRLDSAQFVFMLE
jgi:hypothetical protein